MGTLANKLSQIDHVKEVIGRVLSHFDKKKLEPEIIDQLSQAVQIAFSDHLLFEKFELWDEEQDDEAFLFHIKRFFGKQNQASFIAEESDLSSQRERIEEKIKNLVREKQKRIFSERVTKLAADRGLLTNEQLGQFLGVSGEQARKYKTGENKPHLTTLTQISEKFEVSIEYLVGIST